MRYTHINNESYKTGDNNPRGQIPFFERNSAPVSM
nr:MAG TPA: hypothetical protein [Caudoviricetes sp.]